MYSVYCVLLCIIVCFVLQYKSKTHVESLNGDVMIGSIKQFGKIFSFSLLGTPHSSTCVAFFSLFSFSLFRLTNCPDKVYGSELRPRLDTINVGTGVSKCLLRIRSIYCTIQFRPRCTYVYLRKLVDIVAAYTMAMLYIVCSSLIHNLGTTYMNSLLILLGTSMYGSRMGF